jgi:hypothetical protein
MELQVLEAAPEHMPEPTPATGSRPGDGEERTTRRCPDE